MKPYPTLTSLAAHIQVFELLTGDQLFASVPGPATTADEHQLASMLSLTGESFSSAMIMKSERRNELFDSESKLFCL